MGYVHAHQGRPIIEEVAVQVVCKAMGKRNGKDKQKAKKFSPIINQMPTPRLEHLKI